MTDSPRSILMRLEQLKHWQEEQQRVLLEKHLAQQQLLEREQRKMYAVLGLSQHSIEEGREESFGDSDSEPEYEETNLQAQLAAERLQERSVKNDAPAMLDSDTEQPPTAEQDQEALQRARKVPKKRFLKRGEGLRARFKVDPDKFKLENLPKYKFANHNRERNNRKSGIKQQKQSDGGATSSKSEKMGGKRDGKLNENRGRTKSDHGIVLDVNRVLDKKLETGRRIGGSLPMTSTTDANDAIATDNGDDQICFANIVKRSKIKDVESVKQKPPAKPDVPWKQRLEPPIPSKASKEQQELNFFELLEQKVVGKNFNPDSSSILRFIAGNDSTVNEDSTTTANDDTDDTFKYQLESDPLVRQEEVALKDRVLVPPPPTRGILNDHDSDESDADEDENHAHVHFVDNDDQSKSSGNESESDGTDHETYHRMQQIASSKMSTPNDKIISNLQSLEQTDQPSERSDDEDATADSTNGRSEAEDTPVAMLIGDDTLRSDILAKSELLKERLNELEREIDNYRRENAELIQAKQEHELDRLKLQQDREEMEERINDERIKMEVYFHDERMKIETERKQALREAQKPNKKDKEEILRLTEELIELRKQQKEREAKHSASLARFRSQLKTVEKELQEVRLELEVAKKDNRRLETENTRLKRQNNSRMLVEINRNIAKLAAGGAELVEQQAQKDAKLGPSVDKARKGVQTINRPKTQPVQATKEGRKAPQMQVTKVKVTSHQPVRNSKPAVRGKSLPTQEDILSSETDEYNENGVYPLNGTSDEDTSVHAVEKRNSEDESDDDDGDGAFGENSSSAPSAYFPPNPTVRKTLFNAVNLNTDISAQPRQGLVRKENPTAQCDLLDRTPEAAELIKSMKREIVNADGSRDIWYPNGNLKKISADGFIIRMLYFNKDIKETNMAEGTTKYYYFETNTWHTTYLDGLEILEFPDGQTEHRFKDGSTEVHFPNGSIRTTNPNSADIAEEWKYPDGTTVIIRKNDDKEINLPNGQVEIHTKAHKRRIYPDGTIKFVYPDGSQESRYSNGRVRLKDKDGRLLSDTGGGTGTGAKCD
ncbi:centromere protein J [Anopheles maculipalpis]|uniref:centromere protein J n=1 Tax=Anopheles maculipalpis TaxID=1496333 RepID=UPI002158BFE2|nr:centromere protein J [Anopheles maculipalpis]